MTPTEEYTERYKQIERHSDTIGRVIGVHRLRMSQQMKISEMTPGLEGTTEVTTLEGEVITISRRSLPLIAAAVCEIDGIPIPFPKSRGELDSIMDRLDEPGILAAIEASNKLNPKPAPKPQAGGDSTDDEDAVEQAKN
jgi:hypothetical protein